MHDELKFRDVVRRALLNGQTAQYVLKHPEALSGMPEAGSQGAHRRFSLRQATRLAVCTHLVTTGVALAQAGRVVDFVERRVRMLSKEAVVDNRPFQGDLGRAWLLEIIDSTWVTVWKQGISHRFAEEGEYWDIDDLKKSTVVAEVGSITRVEINLTAIETRLANL